MDILRRMLHHFKCQHLNLSRVWTFTRGMSYVTCLDCGAELSYSMKEMKLVSTRPLSSAHRILYSRDRS